MKRTFCASLTQARRSRTVPRARLSRGLVAVALLPSPRSHAPLTSLNSKHTVDCAAQPEAASSAGSPSLSSSRICTLVLVQSARSRLARTNHLQNSTTVRLVPLIQNTAVSPFMNSSNSSSANASILQTAASRQMRWSKLPMRGHQYCCSLHSARRQRGKCQNAGARRGSERCIAADIACAMTTPLCIKHPNKADSA